MGVVPVLISSLGGAACWAWSAALSAGAPTPAITRTIDVFYASIRIAGGSDRPGRWGRRHDQRHAGADLVFIPPDVRSLKLLRRPRCALSFHRSARAHRRRAPPPSFIRYPCLGNVLGPLIHRRLVLVKRQHPFGHLGCLSLGLGVRPQVPDWGLMLAVCASPFSCATGLRAARFGDLITSICCTPGPATGLRARWTCGCTMAHSRARFDRANRGQAAAAARSDRARPVPTAFPGTVQRPARSVAGLDGGSRSPRQGRDLGIVRRGPAAAVRTLARLPVGCLVSRCRRLVVRRRCGGLSAAIAVDALRRQVQMVFSS